jgi:hypothetical protein
MLGLRHMMQPKPVGALMTATLEALPIRLQYTSRPFARQAVLRMQDTGKAAARQAVLRMPLVTSKH